MPNFCINCKHCRTVKILPIVMEYYCKAYGTISPITGKPSYIECERVRKDCTKYQPNLITRIKNFLGWH